MKRISVILISVVCLAMFCGCWDKHELEDNTFAVILGVDAAESMDITVTIAFPPTQTEGDGGDYSVMSVKARTLAEGLDLFGTKLSGPLALYSVKTVVISREIAESDTLRQVFASWRHEEIRSTTSVVISECGAAEFIEARIKNSPIDPLRQEELLLEQINGSAYYKPIQLLELLAALKSNSGDGVAMYGGVAPENKDEADEDKYNIEQPVRTGYLPDEIPIASENKSRISGLAVFRGSKMVGVLDSMEAQTYCLLTQSGTQKLLTVPDPLAPEHNIAVEILPAGKNKINSEIRGGIPVFTIDVKLKCTLESVQSGVDYTSPQNLDILTEHIEQACAESMASLLLKTQTEYNADILRLGDKLAYHFYTVGEWEQYNWAEQYKNAEINLNVRVDIARTGITQAPIA